MENPLVNNASRPVHQLSNPKDTLMIDFVQLPGGEFAMGLAEHGLEPVRAARVDTFKIGKTPVTWA